MVRQSRGVTCSMREMVSTLPLVPLPVMRLTLNVRASLLLPLPRERICLQIQQHVLVRSVTVKCLKGGSSDSHTCVRGLFFDRTKYNSRRLSCATSVRV